MKKLYNSAKDIKESEIWKYLYKINQEYAQICLEFINQITPILNSIQDYFPNYTRHDANHSFKVVKRIEQIILNDCIKIDHELSFTAQEAFLLITSAYAHDLGMALFPNEEDILTEKLKIPKVENWKNNKILQDFLRENHSTRGAKFILENLSTLKIPLNLVKSLGDLMRSHNLSLNELEIELRYRFAAGEQEIELTQLACILCIADSLEFSDTRVIDGVLDRIKDSKEIELVTSYRENLKHKSLGDSVAISNKDNRVIFSGTFTDPDVLAITHNTIDLIEDWVKQYCEIENKSQKKRLKILGLDFSRNLTIPNFEFERLGIKIQCHLVKQK